MSLLAHSSVSASLLMFTKIHPQSKKVLVLVQIHLPVLDYYSLLWVASCYVILAKLSLFSIPKTYSRIAGLAFDSKQLCRLVHLTQ